MIEIRQFPILAVGVPTTTFDNVELNFCVLPTQSLPLLAGNSEINIKHRTTDSLHYCLLPDNGGEMIDVPTTTEYDKIDARETELYEKLRATLSGEQIKLFDEFVEQYSYRHSLIAESYYVRVLNSAFVSPSNASTSPTLTQEVKP